MFVYLLSVGDEEFYKLLTLIEMDISGFGIPANNFLLIFILKPVGKNYISMKNI